MDIADVNRGDHRIPAWLSRLLSQGQIEEIETPIGPMEPIGADIDSERADFSSSRSKSIDTFLGDRVGIGARIMEGCLIGMNRLHRQQSASRTLDTVSREELYAATPLREFQDPLANQHRQRSKKVRKRHRR